MTYQRVTKHGNFFTMHLLSIENRKERAGGAIYQSNNEKGTLAHKIPKIRAYSRKSFVCSRFSLTR